jgi:hypothetical protein
MTPAPKTPGSSKCLRAEDPAGMKQNDFKKVYRAKTQRKGTFISPNLACFASLRESSFSDPVISLVRLL